MILPLADSEISTLKRAAYLSEQKENAKILVVLSTEGNKFTFSMWLKIF